MCSAGGSKLDFRGVSRGWLREMTQAWCWDNLNRFDDFGSFIKEVNEIGNFSEYLRAATHWWTGHLVFGPPGHNRLRGIRLH